MEIIPHANTKGKKVTNSDASCKIERPEQRGNDKADKIAKKLMNQAETLEPLPYFITAEEKFLAYHKDTLITDNIAHGSRNKN